MQIWTIVLFVCALAAAGGVTASMLRRPILARMASRNALRRPRQTSTVVAGLMVGTAIVAAALVAGGSAGSAIRGYVYQSLGEVDESVSIDGYPYFPQSVYDGLRSDPTVAGEFDAISAHAIWAGAAENPQTDLFEPNVAIVGYEPEADAWFGDFSLVGGGSTDGRDLQRGQAIVTKHLADELDLDVGDKVQVSYTPPVDPILPEVFLVNGTLTFSADASGLLGLPLGSVTPIPATHTFPVNRSASFITVVLGWDAAAAPGLGPLVSLQASLADPEGNTYATAAAVPGDPTVPLFLNVTSAVDETLPVGDWTLTVSSSLAVQEPYQGVIVVAYPVYDLALLRERARALSERFGDESDDRIESLTHFSDRSTTEFTAVAITDGGRGDLFDLRDALFIDIDEAQAMWGREDQVNLIKFSNPGDAKSGVQSTERAMQIINASLDRERARLPDVASVQSVEAQPLKQRYIEVADEAGQTLTGLLVFAGSLSIITGLFLILNIFTMLAEERRSELGMARAVGLTQGDLVRLFLYEGSLYAVAAAALGAVLGLGLAWGMIQILNALISNFATEVSFPPIPFQPTWTALLVAFSVGVLLTFATIAGASRRASRLNVVRAIRRIEEPERAGSRGLGNWLGVPLLALGITATLLGWIDADFFVGDYAFSFQVFGALAAVIGLTLLLRPFVRRSRLLPAMAALLAIYYTASYFLITVYTNIDEANIVGPIRGVLLTLCVVVLVVHFEAMSRFLGRLMARTHRLRAVAIPAVSYPLHKRFRTGMTLAMFSVVILSIGFFSIFGALFQVDPARQTGGFDIDATTTLSVPDLAEYDRGLVPEGTLKSSEHLVAFASEDPGFITVSGGRTGSFGEVYHRVFGYEQGFVQAQKFRLLWRDEAYADDEAAYQAVLDDGDKVIVSYQYSTDSRGRDLQHKVGETLEINLGDESLPYTIIGIQEQFHYQGIFLPNAVVEGLFPTTEDLYLYQVQPGVDPVAAAKLLERNYRDVGMDAEGSEAHVLKDQESFRQILGAMKLFLGLGLIVGILSLGIVTSRSVLERRQEIGMLRALGYTGRQVRSIFFIEVSYTLLLGTLVGIACAIVVTYGLWYAIIRELNYPYVIPWGEIGIILVVSYAVAMLATAAPIGRSARVAPAEALRYVE